MKNINDFDTLDQLDMLLEDFKNRNTRPVACTSNFEIAKNITVEPITYRSLCNKLLKDGMIDLHGTSDYGYYVKSATSSLFIGYQRQAKQNFEREEIIKEQAARQKMIELSQIEANESSIRTNKNVKIFSAITLAVLIVQVLFEILNYYKKS